MKRIAFCCAIALAVCGPARSQLILNPGDTFAYSFSSLPLTGFVSSFTAVPSGIFGFTVRSNSFQAGDVLRYEMFENSVAESPIFSDTMTVAPPFSLAATNAGAWQDVQGAVRFTMLSGSVILDSVSVKALVPGPSLSSYNVYDTTFTPVPEPGGMSLFGLGAGLFWMWRSKQGIGSTYSNVNSD